MSDESVSLHFHQAGPAEALTSQKLERVENSRYTLMSEQEVAVMNLVGPIFPRANMMTMSGAVSAELWASEFITNYNSPNVRAILIRGDSPGGDARGIAALASTIYRARMEGKKVIDTYAAGYLCSAAYWIGSASRRIVGDPTSTIGSIGAIITAQRDPSGVIKIKSTQSPLKQADAETEEGRGHLQQLVDDLAQVFINDVAKQRGITPEKVMSDYGKGGTLLGQRALKAGLIDRVGPFEAALHALVTAKPAATTTTADAGTTGPAAAEESDMGLIDKFAAFKRDSTGEATDAGGAAAEGQGQEADKKAAPAAEAAPKTWATMTAEEREAVLAVLEEKHGPAAELFATRMEAANFIYPAQMDTAASAMLAALVQDELMPMSVRFVDARGQVRTGTRVQQVTAQYEALPKHDLKDERLQAVKDGQAAAVVLTEGDKETVETDEQIKARLLGTTLLGQAAQANSATRK